MIGLYPVIGLAAFAMVLVAALDGLHLVILLVAFAMALLAALEVKSPRVHFGWLAIALWILNALIK